MAETREIVVKDGNREMHVTLPAPIHACDLLALFTRDYLSPLVTISADGIAVVRF